MTPLFGIDLGGTKIEGVVIDSPDNPEILCRKRIPTQAKKGYEHIINRIAILVDDLSAESGISPQKIGIGTPGAVDPASGTMKNSNTVCLNGQPLPKDIEDKLGLPVLIENDANCFALAETQFGCIKHKAPEARVIFGVIMGTGVGGGIIVNNTIIKGKHGIGGEWGHNFLDELGGECYCGKTGCVETMISGKALEKYYYKLTKEEKTLRQIRSMAKKERQLEALLTLKRLNLYFGKAIANVINILDPDAIILGGGLGNIQALYTEGVDYARKYIFNPELTTPFLKPELGDSAGVFGAAILAICLDV